MTSLLEAIGKFFSDFGKSMLETGIQDDLTAIREATSTHALNARISAMRSEILAEPRIQTAITKKREELTLLGEPDLLSGAQGALNLLKGQGAKSQLENIAGIKIDSSDVLATRLFNELGTITNTTALACGLEIAGGLIPTTNAQYAGIALHDYLNFSGLSQITGFGYGMLFSNVVSPLLAYELNAKIRPSLPLAGEAIRLGYRKYLTKDQVTEILSKYGFSATYQEAMIKGFLWYPTAQDFIQFAVRETFRPDIVAKYQYDAEYPSEIDPYIEQAGLSHDWLLHYWRAHWILPSPQMGFEMLHRGKITTAELNTLIAIADYAPWWRQKIIDISYSPYTRVDTRRLFVDKVISREEVKRNYLDIGYDDKHAENLTIWTCKQISAEKKLKTRDLTEAAMTRAYVWGQIDADTLTDHLKTLDYDDDEAKLLISLADYQSFEDELAEEWKVLKAEYNAELKDDEAVKKRLTELKLNQREQEKWLRNLKREKRLTEIAAYVAAEKKKATAKKE